MGDEQKIEVLVYGLGAIGSFYAFILQRSSRVRLSVCARSNYEAVKNNGILMKSESHGEHRFKPVGVYRNIGEAKGKVVFDYVLCANKATDLDGTAKDLKEAGCVQEGKTSIVLMQNGVGNEDPFHEVFPKCTILSGVVWVGATQDSPGIVRQHVSEDTTIGIFSNSGIPKEEQQASLDLFTALFTEGGTPFTIDASIQTPKWKKCIWNAAWNSLTTLTGCDCHEWLKSSDYAMDATRRLMNEAMDVARAAGVPGIDDGLADELINKMLGFNGPVFTSMYQDAKNGRAMEVDVILGSIMKKGRKLGVPVPTVEVLYAMLIALGGRIAREGKQ